jgi:hypothetical protein
VVPNLVVSYQAVGAALCRVQKVQTDRGGKQACSLRRLGLLRISDRWRLMALISCHRSFAAAVWRLHLDFELGLRVIKVVRILRRYGTGSAEGEV